MSTPGPAARGDRARVEWAIDRRGGRPAQEFFDRLPIKERAKVLALFQRLADVGVIVDNTKFRKLVDIDLWEFKVGDARFLGRWARGAGRCFLVSHGVRKRSPRLRAAELERAARVLAEHEGRVHDG